MCCVSPVTCHLPQTLPLITPPLCTVGRFANPKNPKNPIAKVIKTAKTQNMSKGMPILAIGSLTRSLQSTGKRGFQMWPDRQMYRSRTLRLINWILSFLCWSKYFYYIQRISIYKTIYMHYVILPIKKYIFDPNKIPPSKKYERQFLWGTHQKVYKNTLQNRHYPPYRI